ncbi:MAG: hypothetical protein JWM41_1315 [Gemmatimonadetes bacterium]|nr:hypothetical protein [Gemmatimonadota bacterium]
MKAIHTLASAALLVIAATACNKDLTVENLSNPDVARVFATGASIEATIAAAYQTVHNGTTNQALWPETLMHSLEQYSSLNNFNMGVRVAIPRAPIVNSNGAPTVFTEFSALSRESRLSVEALDALDKYIKAGNTLGTHAQDLRARSFGFFGAAASLGWLAIIYDSAGIVSTGMPSDSIPPLSAAADVMKAALTLFDSAYAIAIDPAASTTGGFPLPTSWLSTSAAVSADQYARLIRSYRARFRAGVARTPAQRAAVDWQKVIDDTEGGIQADYLANVGGSTGWNIGDISQIYVDPGWGQMSMMYMGMADVSGAYANFIATPIATRSGYFLVMTPDKRWPAGATRAAQQAASTQPTSLTSKPYISNRTVADIPGDGWGVSFYDFFRFKYIRNASNIGLYPDFLKAENDLLAAEAYLRTGNIAAAAAKIDITRVGNGGLPALSGTVTSATQVVPGGASCVPQVPNGATVSCGTLLEALKYEKRMETALSSFGRWWIDSRGWGDLITNTVLEYPVPYQEMQARQKVSYNLGGGSASSAAKGTYGF